jgi:UDP-GlcNAc3NAcA epimerase
MTTSKATDGRLRIVTIVGARPQFIKAATVSRAIAAHNTTGAGTILEEKLVHTGQHYDDNMSRVFFEELEIPEPAYNLGIGSGSHGEQTGRMLERIEQVLLSEKPDLVLVYGDTNSTLAGALVAAKLHIPVAHVEAGLRSFVRTMPEEINRVLTDHVSDLLFCPTPTAVTNLAREGIEKGVHQVGDVMYDSTLFYARKVAPFEEETLRRLGIARRSFYLATVHRAENTDHAERLAGIFGAFAEVATRECPVIVPLHPRTVKYIHQYGLQVSNDVKIIDPASYLEMVVLEKNARKILTDSGGVQKEAYFLAVPCVTLRDETEWVETVEAGWNILAGSNKQAIVTAVNTPAPRGASDGSLYGNGDAATQICKLLADGERSSCRTRR